MSAPRFIPTRPFTPTPHFVPTPGTIADQLRQHLLSLEYPAFARCICILLEALGYEEARPAGRREWKGYNRPGGGGYDLEAVLPGGLAPRRVIAQIKQYDGLRVHQRSVDELRGACLRAGVAEAVLVTTSSFSKVVQNDQIAQNTQVTGDDTVTRGSACTLFAPVRLIDAKELLTLLICHRLGVRECGKGAAKRLKIDEAFFHALSNDRKAKGCKAKGCKAKDHKTKEKTERRASLTLPESPKLPKTSGLPNTFRFPDIFYFPKSLISPKCSFLLKRSLLPNSYLPRWRVTIRISPKPISSGHSLGKQGLTKKQLTKGGR